MHPILTGALIAVGFFGTCVLMLALLIGRERVEKPQQPAEPPKKLKDMTDGEIRGKVISAAAELDLWVRAATLRHIRIDGTLLTVAGNRPHFRVKVYDHAGGYAEWPKDPAFFGPKVS